MCRPGRYRAGSARKKHGAAMSYQHILLASDLADDTAQVGERAADLARNHGARLTIMHVMEPLMLAYGAEVPVDMGALQQEITRQARERLDALATKLGASADDCRLATGTTEKEVLKFAAEQHVDLIVLGSHGRRGLALLLGSTANAVLNHAGCDVLAVRIRAADASDTP